MVFEQRSDATIDLRSPSNVPQLENPIEFCKFIKIDQTLKYCQDFFQ